MIIENFFEKIKTGIRSLQEGGKENEIVIIWGVAFFLLVVLATASLFLGGKRTVPASKQIELNSTDISSGGTPSSLVSIGSAALFNVNDSPRKLPVYNIIDKNYEPKIEAFLVKNNVTGFKKHANDHKIVWEKGTEVISLDLDRDRIFFNFDHGVQLNAMESKIDEEGGATSYFYEVIRQYFDEELVYADAIVTSESTNTYRVDANRMIDKYKLYWETFDGKVDYMVFNKRGDLLEGRLALVNIDEGNTKSYPISDPNQLPTTINTEEQPRAVFYGNKEFVSGEKYDWSNYDYLNSKPNQGEDIFPNPDICKATDIELVYYYTDDSFGKVTPTYKINCVGSVTFKGGIYEVPGIIFASAIDLKYVKRVE